jgi:NAD(P)H-hydrate epimerase
MIKLLSKENISSLDAYTIKHEPVASIDLMERASKAFSTKFKALFPDKNHTILVFCGVGNNGGDGLAIARLLYEADYAVRSFSIGSLDKATDDFNENFRRLPPGLKHLHLTNEMELPLVSDHEIIIDGLFGSGLSRPIHGLCGQLIHLLNESGATIVSIDIASGLYVDQHSSGPIIQPKHTITFQLPKLAFLLPENHPFVGEWHVVPIGLNEEFIKKTDCREYILEADDVAPAIPKRSKFAHKGDAGRLLIVAGSTGKMGAAILATRAALRTGAGLIFTQLPGNGRDIMQVSVPEAMVIPEPNTDVVSAVHVPDKTNAVAIGPGLGTAPETAEALRTLLEKHPLPMVLDADALNILSTHPEWLSLVPQGSILTPHLGELERLLGPWENDFHRLELTRTFSAKYHVHVVTKGAHSVICHPNGTCYFNSTGNPGMATGGSGDVLTGIIGSLLAQGVPAAESARLGVCLHGLSGDLAEIKYGQLSLSASDLIQYLPEAISQLNGR